MDLTSSSCWNSILEKVQPHIPTIDFDSSSPENEEIITVYKRPAGLSLEIPEDFDSFWRTEEDAELEKFSQAEAQTCWSEESCIYSLKMNDNETTAQWSRPHSDAEPEAGACESNIMELNQAKLDASMKPNVDSTKSGSCCPLLSFARLDQCYLDKIVQNPNESEHLFQPLFQHVLAEPVKRDKENNKCRSQEDIMDRLVAFCKSQSSKSVSEAVKSPKQTEQNNKWNNSLEKMAAELQLSHQECPTVYIDLRCPEPSIKPQRTSPNLSSKSKSPAKYNIHQEAPHAKKLNRNVHTGSRLRDREVTGKSLLLLQNRNKYTDPPDLERGNEAEEMEDKLPQPVESSCLSSDKQPSPEPHMENSPTDQESSVKKTKQQGDQQRHQCKQTLHREQHQQILKRLEKHRPTKSVNQRQSAAEWTDVLYDSEASHLQSVKTLPEDIEKKGCMLLIISLSSPGIVEGKAPENRYPSATKSHIYNTLVVWFLSLVGSDSLHDEAGVSAKVPFWVAGLQQLWTEDGLALHVLAVARHSYTSRKRCKGIREPFYNQVYKFLSETSLTQIASWHLELESLLDQQAYVSPLHLPSSCLSCFISASPINNVVIDRTFGLSPGFYWQTVETQERVCKRRDTTQELHTEVSICISRSDVFLHPLITHYTLQLVVDSGLDVCGLRLLYPPHRLLGDSPGDLPVNQRADQTCQPVFVLAVRGPYAHSTLKDLTSSLAPLLPKKTDPISGSTQEPPLFYSPRMASQVHRELCLWFSGRYQGGSTENHNQPLNRAVPTDDKVRGSLFNINRLSAFLCATTKADIFLVVSPAVPPCCYGQVLAVCDRRGFSLKGLRRLQLQSDGASALKLTNQQVNMFCCSSTVTMDQEELELLPQCLVLILRKENAMHHSVSLPAALMREFKAQNLLGCIHSSLTGSHTVEPSFCFHTVPYSNNLYHMFFKCIRTVPDPSCVILSHQKCLLSPEMEWVVILTLCGKDMSRGLSLLHTVLTDGSENDVKHAPFKLLGLKWLPVLNRQQTNELNPYEVGEQLWRRSHNSLMSSPALVCALRHNDAFASLQKLLPDDYPGNLSILMSLTPEVASRQASVFFLDHEIFPDPQILLTVCLLKPRVWTQTLTKIFHTLQQTTLILTGLRVVTLDESEATSLLSAEINSSEVEEQVEKLCSGSSLVLCLQGENAVKRLLDLMDQQDSPPWTDCYRSGSRHIATEDVKRFFPDGLCCTETNTMKQEQIISMSSDPLASVEREQSCTLVRVARGTLSPSNGSGPDGGSLKHSPLWQTTCLLIPLNAPLLRQVSSQLEIVDQLLRSGCHLVAGRMSILDNEQRRHVAETLKASSCGNEKMSHLNLSWLIMALQGEKVVTGFHLILESIYKDEPELEKVGEMIIYPRSQREAKQLICYLFDALSPESSHTIVPKNPNM